VAPRRFSFQGVFAVVDPATGQRRQIASDSAVRARA
jgi:hypothetical protein